MPDLNKEIIAKLTKLSRIDCSDEEQLSLLQDLKRILNYIDQLQDLNTDNVPPCDHVLADMVNVTRDDKIGSTMPRETFLNNAPSHTGGLIRVPTVLKNGK